MNYDGMNKGNQVQKINLFAILSTILSFAGVALIFIERSFFYISTLIFLVALLLFLIAIILMRRNNQWIHICKLTAMGYTCGMIGAILLFFALGNIAMGAFSLIFIIVTALLNILGLVKIYFTHKKQSGALFGIAGIGLCFSSIYFIFPALIF